MIWILCTIIAATLQSFRNLEQKHLSKNINAFTVSWSRFILPLPFALITVIYTLESVPSNFILYAFIMAVFQVLGNTFLLKTMQSRNFSIGIAFFKTEILQTLILGIVIFGEQISFTAFIAIIIAAIGTFLMSGLVFNEGLKSFFRSIKNKSALFGLLSGFFFSISAFALKSSSNALLDSGYSVLGAPVATLLWVIFFQNILFLVIKVAQNSLIKDFKTLISDENRIHFFKNAILSFVGSIFWFIAYSLGSVVYVKSISQIELIISIAISHYILNERLKPIERFGITLTGIGILGVILFR